MTERELKAVAVGIITYCQIVQTKALPAYDEETQTLEGSAYLDSAALDKTLEICSNSILDDLELFEADDDDDS